MRWPWSRSSSTDRLVISWAGETLAYVQARVGSEGQFEVTRLGVERQGTDNPQDFAMRVKALGLHGGQVHAVLRPEQYQLLQIDAPAVAPEELRAAARYQIREMVESHIDDITIDVMRVGDGQQKGAGHLFVVVAPNAVVRETLEFAAGMDWPVSVVDIAEIGQRNLQTALAVRDGMGQAATAALVVVSERQAVLSISANDELYYCRRLDLPEGFLAMEWGTVVEIFSDEPSVYTPVTEYVPDYGGADSYGSDYGRAGAATLGGGTTGSMGGPAAAQSDTDRAQRLVVEVQRSLDLWDRTWTSLPLTGLRVYAGNRSFDLAAWLSQEIGQTVTQLDFMALFPALAELTPEDQLACLPVLGAMLRTEGAAS